MATIELRKVGKKYASNTVISDLDLTLNDGELTVFVGPSGCGKSTLLRMIAGLESITSGDVKINQQIVNDETPVERGVAMVFQNYALYPHMTVRKNIGFPLEMSGFSGEKVKQRVEAAAESLQLDDLLERKPAQLSGGQRQRVAIGRAIVREPKIFLFDEPLSNLDAELRVQMRLEIARLHKQLSATMIYVTHDQVEAMTLADRIVVMRAGRIEQVGSPISLYDDPNNIFVAGFIGSPKMNLLGGHVSKVTEGGVLVALDGFPGTELPVAVSSTRLDVGVRLMVGIRPEHFSDTGDVVLSTEIEVVENLGGSAYAYLRGDGGQTITAQIEHPRSLRSGMKYGAAFSAEKAFLFDERSSLRIR